MATRRKGHCDRDSKAPKLQRGDAVSTEAAEAQMGAPAAKTPAQLYEECVTAERDTAHLDLDPIKGVFAKYLFFDQPLFEPAPLINHASAIKKEVDLKIRRRLWQAQKYNDILEVLRRCVDRKARLFVISWWLKQEKVCEPEGILGGEELRKMARKKFWFLSQSEFEHANRVRVWLPYFKSLLKDLDDRTVAQLVRLGYQSAAVEAARGKRSAVEAACNWLAVRALGRVDATTLRNAYSRLYGPNRLRRKGCSLEKTTS
jgi:hypothetical protein